MMGKPTRQELQEAETLKVRGNACMQQKKYGQARDYYTRALELAPMGPTSHVYYSNRAAALLSMRNFTEAVWDAERSIHLKPDYPKAHARLGLARFLLGQYQEAVKSYTKAVELEPNNETSITYLEKSKRKVEAASRQIPRVLSMDTHQTDYGDIDDMSLSSRRSITQRAKSTMARANSRRSSIHTTSSFIQPEFTSHDHFSVKSDPSFDVSLSENKLDEANRYKVEGNKAMARRQYSQAIQHYSRALRLSPAGPMSHVYFSNRAAALCYLERYEEAELDAERALALEPEFGKAHARLGLSRYFLKDYHGAVEAYESAVIYDPENESNRIYLAKAKLKLEREQSTSARE
jgi:tetratricopeptide (TPR) repeat protein